MRINALKQTWMPAEWMDENGTHECLFSNCRTDKKSVPDGYYLYEIRDDGSSGDWCSIAESVMVNFWGTILTTQPIDFSSYTDNYVSVTDYAYVGEDTVLLGSEYTPGKNYIAG